MELLAPALIGSVMGLGFCGFLKARSASRKNRRSDVRVPAMRLRNHVRMLSETFHPRDWTHQKNLEECADYIEEHFRKAGAEVASQPVTARGKKFRNVIARFGVGRGDKIVVGAHYDAFEDTPGADDNASGVAGLIELAGLLQQAPPAREVELVAYVLEEPPFFRTRFMGSAVHAASLANKKEPVLGVIVLEMIGYFSNRAGSQGYPLSLFRLWYPDRGNFIGVVGHWYQWGWVNRVKEAMRNATDLPVYSLKAPSLFPGVGLSDHRSYWRYGIPAVMVTDTADYRNEEYHTEDDTADRLDYERMAQVVVGVYGAL